MKVSGLKYWLGRNYSSGYFTKCIESLKHCAFRFLNPKNNENSSLSPQPSENNIEEENNLNSPCFTSPVSASDRFFTSFFADDFISQKELSNEVLKNEICKEIESFKKILSDNNFSMINRISSTKTFWIENGDKLPQLQKLALILLNINSSSACIERYFSICGFASKKERSNISTDLFINRCLLRANISILKDLNEISY